MDETKQLHEQVEYFAAEQDFWRSKYLREHPELDNWEYVEKAREREIEAGTWQ